MAMAMAAVRTTAASDSIGAVRSRERQITLRGADTRPALFPERRSSSRHAGGKDAPAAVLPAPLGHDLFLHATCLLPQSRPLVASLCHNPRLSRGPPLQLSLSSDA